MPTPRATLRPHLSQTSNAPYGSASNLASLTSITSRAVSLTAGLFNTRVASL